MLLIIGFLAGLGLFIVGMGGIIVSFQEGFTSGSFYFVVWLISGLIMVIILISFRTQNCFSNDEHQ
jgi:O-antigen/teichoic acid export membrane protein